MAFSVLIVSCHVEEYYLDDTISDSEIQLLTQSGDINQALENSLKEISSLELEDLINQVYNFDRLSVDPSKENVVVHINQVFEKHGVKDVIDVSSIDDIMNNYFYASTFDNYHHFLVSLKNKNEISANEFRLLDELDTKVAGITDFEVILKTIGGFKNSVDRNPSLSKDERLRLSNFVIVYQTFITAFSSNPSFQEKGACIDCLADNGIKISFWSSLVFAALLTFCLAVAVPTYGIGLYPCLAGVFGASIMAGLSVCGKYCFGDTPYCPNPSCPSGFSFEAETARCCLKEAGVGVFTSGGGTTFITYPELSNNCPPGWTWNSLFEICARPIDAEWDNITLNNNDNTLCVTAECY